MQIFEDWGLAIVATVGIVVLATSSSTTVSLFGVGVVLLPILWHVRTVAKHTRLQTEALLLIAEGQDA